MQGEKDVKSLQMLIPLKQGLKDSKKGDRLIIFNIIVIKGTAGMPTFLPNLDAFKSG